jgi:hypothetical protein
MTDNEASAKRKPQIVPMRDGSKRGGLVRESTSKHLGKQISEKMFVRRKQDTRRLSVMELLGEIKISVKKFQDVIYPHNKIAIHADHALTFILIYTAIITPFELAFLQKPKIDLLFVTNRIVDLGFFYDVSLSVDCFTPHSLIDPPPPSPRFTCGSG